MSFKSSSLMVCVRPSFFTVTISSTASAAGFCCAPGVPASCFFFSSRRRHTRYIGDWSSDVCSSDLGTGAAVRARGFTLPAAGKTGTSRDGWFAGFTSNLLCVIWIGFDDNRDLGITGGAADAPIWADFMTKATSISPYRDVKDFSMPDGVQSVVIDPESLQLATPNCPTTREEVYVAGSAPTDFCELHGGHGTVTSTGSVLSQIFGGQPKTPDANGQVVMKSDPNRPPDATGQPGDASAENGDKKKNPLQKIFGIFGGKKKEPNIFCKGFFF